MATYDEDRREGLKQGHQAAKAVRSYLLALQVGQGPQGGDTRSLDKLRAQLEELRAAFKAEDDPLKALRLLPRIDKAEIKIKEREADQRARDAIGELTEGFIEWAKIFGDTHGIKYDHWIKMKVPAEILAKAGIER